MPNLLFGLLTIGFCVVGYYYAWKFQLRNDFKKAVLLVILCGLALRIYTSTDFFLHEWDERYHALVAKNIIQHPLKPTLYDIPVLPYDYKNWTANHVWLHKQPLPLWTMALSMWLFGVNEIALRLPSVILTTTGIWLTFFIGAHLFDRKVGFLAAFFYSVNGLIIELTAGRMATDHIDAFFLFFVQLAVFFSICFALRQKTIYNILAGVSIGAAVLSKWLPALIVLPIWLLIVLDSGNFSPKKTIAQFFVLVASCILIFLPWQLYIFNVFPEEASWETSYNFRHFIEIIEEHSKPFYYFADRIRISYGELVYLPLLWFSLKTIKNLRDHKRLAVFIWFFIPFLFFSFAETKMQAYILFTCPALFIMTAEFWHKIAAYRTSRKLKWLMSLILFLLIALPVRYSVERVKPFRITDRNPQWKTDLRRFNDKKINNGVLFNYDKPVEAMFYTSLIAYPHIPDKKIISELVAEGYTVIINGNIPENLKEMDGIIPANLAGAN